MYLSQYEWKSADGVLLHGRMACPGAKAGDGVCRGVVIITHGFGEHSGRYGHVITALVAARFCVVTYDLRGHGRSTGRRGDAAGFTSFLEDLQGVVREVRALRSEPIFLYGHSFGGLITLRFLQEYPGEVEGAIAASPWIQLAFKPPAWKLALGRVALRLCPGLRQFTGMKPSRLSRDQTFLATLPDLHLSHHHLSARLFFSTLETCTLLEGGDQLLDGPLLLIHGESDPITSWQATRAFRERCVEGRECPVTFKLYPETMHETHNDLNRNEVLADVVAWLEVQAAKLALPVS